MEHLPECPWANPIMKAYSDIVFGRDYPCQMCKALRACEQRVRSEWALKVVDAKKEGFAEGIKEGRRRTACETKTQMKESYQEGRAAALREVQP